MEDLSRFYNIWQIDPASDRCGYKRCAVSLSKEFLQQQGFHEMAHLISLELLSNFHNPKSDIQERALAGLCLRCYVSEPILRACLKIDRLFGEIKSFTYQDLLPFVLNDDGEALLIFAPDDKTQLIVDHHCITHPTLYRYFSMQILRTFQPNAQSRMSLDNWVYLQTKQNPELKNFLSEFGFKPLSDWALLNRARVKQFDRLSDRDRHIIAAFHAVYRRDRRQQSQGLKRCPDPTIAQLHEMGTLLQARKIHLQAPELIAELRQVALKLRQYDIWSYREPLELDDAETGERELRSDLPHDPGSQFDAEQLEQQELLTFVYEQLHIALTEAIQYEIPFRISQLKTSKGYAVFSDQYLSGLYLYYQQGKTLKDIATELDMSSWAQARRVFNLQELISCVRRLTLRQVLHRILQTVEAKGLIQGSPSPDYLATLVEQIEILADTEIFQAAFEEIQSGRNRQMNSLYARKLCAYLEGCTEVIKGDHNA